jgi:hypothetical protein
MTDRLDQWDAYFNGDAPMPQRLLTMAAQAVVDRCPPRRRPRAGLPARPLLIPDAET